MQMYNILSIGRASLFVMPCSQSILMTHWKHYLTFIPIGCIKCDIHINSSTCNFCLFNFSLFYVGSVAHFT